MASSSSFDIPDRKASVAAEFGASLVASFRSSSPLAQEVLARDLADLEHVDHDHQDDADLGTGVRPSRDTSAASVTAASDLEDDEAPYGPTLYRRPSNIAFGTTRPALCPGGPVDEHLLTKAERTRSREAERSLLRDNHILPPKHPRDHRPAGLLSGLYARLFSTKLPRRESDAESPAPRIIVDSARETDPLLGSVPTSNGDEDVEEHLDEQWDAAVAAGQIKTTWQREAKTIAGYSSTLIITFMLQYSLNVASIFAVARLGTLELGAVTLASMTANITFYAPVQGLATSLDTLCSQAFGSGRKELLGLQLQRMTYFLWTLLIPTAVLWLNAEPILATMIEPDSARLAAVYLRIILLGTPGYAAFEGGKRFVQAQGLFSATTYVLLVAAPANVLMNWLFVWHLGWGFQGAPIAVAITQNMLPLLLFLYVWKVDGSQAWGGFTRLALKNWWPMIRMSLGGMVMVVAEWLAFEVLTLASGTLGVSTLAAQSILVTVTSTTFQIPFPMSIAGSTRVANLIGAKLVDAAKTSAKVTAVGGILIGIFNLTLLAVFRYQIPLLFTHDADVVELVAQVLPVCAIMQLFDGLAAVSHGLLRGIGRQEFGGIANLVCYYVVALPISFGLGFGLQWGLTGLWVGVTVGLLLYVSLHPNPVIGEISTLLTFSLLQNSVALVEYWFIWQCDWDQIVKEADDRNTSG
ncbi:mate-domain-containing protein [Apodospora peruviana]|uniref:Mate-domain-containing protein n=1 Tax=Apodospora peruviana TaxID=516989 RepID=A0AAE0I6I8_9PEZI|nr:mate-domain-containing protein [Apodospora peruviana]